MSDKPREFTLSVDRGFWVTCTDTPNNNQLKIGEVIHVIEMSAFDALKKENEQLVLSIAWANLEVTRLREALSGLHDHLGHEWCPVCDENAVHCEMGKARDALRISTSNESGGNNDETV